MKTFLVLLSVLLGAGAWPALATNTLVRFTYYHGAVTVGHMDVELFDQEKPVTVSNFLKYVRSGAYDNLHLHRVVPGFVMQAGAVRTVNPLSSASFSGYLNTPDFGAITNEFGVGPRYSNTVGMLAMARAIPGGSETNYTHEERVQATNSASTDWFINLADNSGTLDTNWGGFTVFGRVVGESNRVMRGAGMLDFFTRTNSMMGILEMDFLWFPGLSLFASVPVGYPTRYPYPRTPAPVKPYWPPLPKFPRYSDLYHVRIAELPVVDFQRPTVSITYPSAGAKLTNTLLTFTGTATDNEGIQSLWYAVTGRDFTNVPAGNSWSVTSPVPAGTNYFYVQSVDTSGQRSPIATRTFFMSVMQPLTLNVVGPGIVSGATNGQVFEIERQVNLTARPQPNHMFAGWTGSFPFEPASVRFLMFSNANLTATFVTNPFPPLKATYAGLFYNTNFSVQQGSFQVQPSGGITLNVTELGAVSGKLTVAGRSLPFSGRISPYGVARIPVAAGAVSGLFGASSTWYVEFNLDVTNRSDQIRGAQVWDTETFSSALAMERVRPGTLTSPSPFAGKYTVAIAPGTNSTQPRGWGYGAATINPAGTIALVGQLADGTPFTQTAPVISTNGLWPFYAGLYAGRGWLWGWLKVNPGQIGGDVSGPLVWRKTGPQAGKPYPNGFEFYPALTGSRYTPATTTNRVLEFSDGILSLTGPSLAAPLTNQVSLAVNNTVVNLDTNRLTWALVKPSGLFSGTVQPVGESRVLSYKGAVLQSQGYGVGYYLSTNLSGRVYFGP